MYENFKVSIKNQHYIIFRSYFFRFSLIFFIIIILHIIIDCHTVSCHEEESKGKSKYEKEKIYDIE